jgi:cyclopropane fatty-acyl-phospholipid synthase-like methyltransferase
MPRMRCMIREPAAGRAIETLRRRDRYPRASKYDPAWVLSLDMGPHPLWQLEDLLPSLALAPGMRVLDLGAGQGATSVFLARECDVDVVALDLWIPSEQAGAVHEAAGVDRRHGRSGLT